MQRPRYSSALQYLVRALRALPHTRLLASAAALSLLSIVAQAASDAGSEQPDLSARKIFALLFLMLGPIKILLPFVDMTEGADAAFRRKLALRAVLFSAAALALAGLTGRTVLANFNVPVSVLALTGGLVLFLVALQTVLQQFAGPMQPRGARPAPELKWALNPLAFPIIVTPYGIAAIIVFVSLAGDDTDMKIKIAEVVAAILLLNLLAMWFAQAILKWFGTLLQIFAVVLGVTQIALGLHLIIQALGRIGVFTLRGG
jgi:multiple antibiotic resistance protein